MGFPYIIMKPNFIKGYFKPTLVTYNVINNNPKKYLGPHVEKLSDNIKNMSVSSK